MAKFMSQGAVIEMAHSYFPSHLRSRRDAEIMGAWMEGKQYEMTETLELDPDHPAFGRAYSPDAREITAEYENLRSLAPNPFANLVVTAMAQLNVMEGISRPGTQGLHPIYETFRRNRWGSKQDAVYRGALGQSVSYGLVLPGEDPLTGSKMSRMLARSAVQMSAFYDTLDDEWPRIAIEAEPAFEYVEGTGMTQRVGWQVKVHDTHVTHRLLAKGDGRDIKNWEYIDHEVHGIAVPPVARCANRMDLDGNAHGEIEPILPLLRRLDQDLFDRLINQRFGAWQVRYIAGMAKPSNKDAAAAQKLRLRVEDLLVAENENTKFGTLPAGPLEPQIKATDADLRLLSAITQMPPHHLLGLSSNLQAEALAAANEGMVRRSRSFRQNASEFNEQMARLAAMAEGDMVTAAAWDLSIRWADTEATSMSQAADALGKLAIQLGVPIEMLWERIPGWNDEDVERAKTLVEQDGFEKLIRELIGEREAGPAPAAAGGASNEGSGGDDAE